MPSMYDDTNCAVIAQLHGKIRRILAQVVERLRFAELLRPQPHTLTLAGIEAGGSIDLGIDLLKVRPSINSHIRGGVLPDIAKDKKAEKRAVTDGRGLLEPPKALSRAKGRGHREQWAAR